MKVNKAKLKNATEADLIREINLVIDELSDNMHPASWARCKKLIEYKTILQEELRAREK